ncbi:MULTISPECIES: hypothetical protein [Streptomyces]|uniref:Helix-turn-helix domain-containing protein n=1 Tax=Streptomyces luteosporeus TaxID=173856 RepID=A0ABN3TPV1_9ACTN
MLRHVTAPERFYTQVPNEILRHPRLSPHAVRILTWALSLADPSAVSLSEVGLRAGIKKTAYTRAKQELIQEGYFHEWPRQGARGRWVTEQLVSSVPLSAEEAVAVRDGKPPTDDVPTVGEPERRAVGRSQEKNGENIPNPPLPQAERAALALAAVSHGERRLRLSGRDVRALVPLAAEWFARGATLGELRTALTSGLPDVVHSPAGLARNRLVRKMPDPVPALPAAPRPNPPRPCLGGCGRVFRAVADEDCCRDCRQEAAADVSGAVEATRRGIAAVRAALCPRPS